MSAAGEPVGSTNKKSRPPGRVRICAPRRPVFLFYMKVFRKFSISSLKGGLGCLHVKTKNFTCRNGRKRGKK